MATISNAAHSAGHVRPRLEARPVQNEEEKGAEPARSPVVTLVIASFKRAIDAFTLANLSITRVNESKTLVSQVIAFESHGSITIMNESNTSVIDSNTLVSQLTCFQSSGEPPGTDKTLSRPESIIRKFAAQGGTPLPNAGDY